MYLLLLDIWILGKPRFDVLEELRNTPAPPRVIVLTQDITSATLLQAIREQAYMYLSKPIESNALLAVIEGWATVSPTELPIDVIFSLPDWVELGQTSTKRLAPRWTRRPTNSVLDA